MLFPKDKMSRIVILVVAVVAVLIPLNVYQKKLGKNVALVSVVAVLVVAAGLGYMIMNETEEGFSDNTISPAEQQQMAQQQQVAQQQQMAQQQQVAQQMAQQQAAQQQAAQQMAQQQAAQQQQMAQNVPQEESEEQMNVLPNNGNNSVPQQVVQVQATRPNDCVAQQTLNPQELLPRDTNSTWAQTVPSGQGSLEDKSFLNAGFHVGVNTVGQSLRNANRQLRSDPPNPQVKVSPWLQSTIEPDVNRRPLEIGGGN